METSALSVLQQLTSNPQLVGQLQNLLTTLSSTDDEKNGVFAAGRTERMSSGVAANASSSSASMNTTTRVGGVPSSSLRSVDAGVSLQRYEKLVSQYRQLEEQMEQKTREASDASQRVSHLEKETSRLMRQVEQLVGVVEGQRKKLEEARAKHELEIAEIENRHELEMRSRADKHEETLRRLVSAQRLMTTAAQFDQTVKSSRSGSGGGATAGRKVSNATTPSSKGITQSRPGSSIKQQQQMMMMMMPRHDETSNRKEMEKEEKDEFAARPRGVAVKRERDDVINISPVIQRKKRTPRTPSLTAADRVAAAVSTTTTTSASHSKALSYSGKKDHSSPHTRTVTAFTENEYSLKERNPSSTTVSPGPATSTITEAMARHHHQQQQQQSNVMNRVEAKFISQYGTGGLPPASSLPLPPPVPLSTSTTPRLATLSRTPRQKGFPQTQLAQRQMRSEQRSGTSSVVGGPTRSPSPVNPKRGAEQPRCFVVTSLSDEERANVKAAVAQLGQNGVVVESDYEDPPPFTTTHVVVRGPPRSMKALCGVVGSKWLVQPEYIYASRDVGFWLDEYDEGGLRCFPPPLKCQRFLLTMPDGVVKDKLEQVIEYGGGEVVRPAQDGRSYDQGVIVIASGDDLLRFATRME